MQKTMGKAGKKSIALGFGFLSSSCSFAGVVVFNQEDAMFEETSNISAVRLGSNTPYTITILIRV